MKKIFVLMLIYICVNLTACSKYIPNITMWEAAKLGNQKAMQYYVKHTDINQKNEDGQTILTLACQHNHLEIVKLLLKNGALVNAYPNLVVTLFSEGDDIVAKNAILQELMQHGADANLSLAAYRHGHLENRMTPLGVAIVTGNTPAVKLLLQHNADVNLSSFISGKEELFPLIQAINNGNNEVVKELTKYGAKVKEEYSIGDDISLTPLGYAIMRGETEIVKTLLEAGAYENITVKDKIQLGILVPMAKNDEIWEIFLDSEGDDGYFHMLAKSLVDSKEKE